MKNHNTPRQNKIANILGLINGEINPTDIAPRMILRISIEGQKTFTINNKEVNEDCFHEELSKWPWESDNFQTFGRADENEEYYY